MDRPRRFGPLVFFNAELFAHPVAGLLNALGAQIGEIADRAEQRCRAARHAGIQRLVGIGCRALGLGSLQFGKADALARHISVNIRLGSALGNHLLDVALDARNIGHQSRPYFFLSEATSGFADLAGLALT
jgi:hypothetical protein